ncbi:type II toxin-antitoxin system HicB family antitoxin [Methylobrevis pamukkalensis]|uniref:Antitoxin HicB n=1 Tax=Methylobrevis pamukkalensis TaxID=1439726 RepID=A0A1E3H1J2_9HYPH|nr:type II toxin-antitoxin system HicB family antitoxin [Methylobrevis pamukkalensis]ODN70199.1 Antitoxin HicB [Methylobrevis pamukkalensis]
MRTYTYPALFEPGDDPAVTVVSFPDVPEAITEGTGEAEARANAADALGLALLAILRAGRTLPAASPAPAMPQIAPEPEVAAKLAVIEAFLAADITRTELAHRLGIDEKAARRILDPMHPTKLPTLSAALAAMGQRLVIGVEAA